MKHRLAETHNAWEGFDTGENSYNEKEDQRYQSAIWKFLLLLSVLMLAFVVFIHIKELNTIHNGTSFVADYYVDTQGRSMASYHDTTGRLHVYQISAERAIINGDTITMYYTDDINDAIIQSTWTSWVWYYLIFGIIFAISLWRLIKIYKK